MARDPRVVDVWHEESDDDWIQAPSGRWRRAPSLWVELAEGYNFDGCMTIHAYSVKDLFSDLSRVEDGPTY